MIFQIDRKQNLWFQPFIITSVLTLILFSIYLEKAHGGNQILSTVYTYTNEINHPAGDSSIIQEYTFTIASSLTLIENIRGKIIIDYKNNFLVRIAKSENICKKFRLVKETSDIISEMDKDLITRQQINHLLGSIKLYESDQIQEISGFQTKKKTVLFGADLRMLRMVASPVISRLGQKFTESKNDYWVSHSVPFYNRIFETAIKRKAVFDANPFLLQIDFLGLLHILNGFPVRIVTREDPRVLIYTLQKTEEKYIPLDLFSVSSDCIAIQE